MFTNGQSVTALLSNLFARKRQERRKQKATSKLRGRRNLQMEGLEKREMFAISSLGVNGGALQIWTDNNATSVTVSTNGNNYRVSDNTTSRTWDFAKSSVGRVDFIGGAGNDRFVNMIPTMNTRAWGQGGNDYLEGYNGVDEFYGGDNNDTLVGFGGNDILRGGNGNDYIQGGMGVDNIYGEAGNDHLEGGYDGDFIWGGDNDDTLLGNDGDDQLVGDAGNDQLNGGAGLDRMWGYAGNDTLISVDGAFTDYLDGGADADVFWADGVNNVFQRGFDTIYGATSADTLNQFAGFTNGADMTLDGDNLSDPSDIGSKLTFRNTITADNTHGTNPLFAGPGITMTTSGLFLPTSAGPKSTDVTQGALGDCWITSSLSSMALVNPNMITRSVVDFNDGTYGVRLGNFYYRVDNEFGVQNTASGAVSSNLTYAKLGSQNSMWVAVVEKAFAAYRSGVGTYAKLTNGYAEDVFKLFRMNNVGESLSLGKIYGSATYMANDFYNRYLNGYSQTIGAATNTPNSNHAFTVAGFTRDATGAIAGIVLRNPWGYDGLDQFNVFAGASSGSSTMDGTFTVSITTLFNSGAWTSWASA